MSKDRTNLCMYIMWMQVHNVRTFRSVHVIHVIPFETDKSLQTLPQDWSERHHFRLQSDTRHHAVAHVPVTISRISSSHFFLDTVLFHFFLILLAEGCLKLSLFDLVNLLGGPGEISDELAESRDGRPWMLNATRNGQQYDTDNKVLTIRSHSGWTD